MATVAYGSLPFQQQIAFFRGKRNVLTESYLDVWEAQHDTAFMVAGANRIDLLADLREAVRRAIEDGETLANFRARFDVIVAKHGWDYNGGRNWRTRVIYETNLRQSYNAGRWAQEQKLKKAMPWKRYRHSDAVEHPRPVHESWDGKIWAVDDPVWLVIHPQNGWGCQCSTELLSDRDLRRLGKTGPDAPLELKWVDVMVGQRSPGGPRLVRTVEGIDPGFAYAPGSSLDTWPVRRGGPVTPPAMQRGMEQATQELLRKSTRLPASTAAAMLADAMQLERARDALQAGYAAFQAAAIENATAARGNYLVGMLGGDLLQVMGTRGITPASAAVSARAEDVLRAIASGTAADQLAQLPTLLRDARAVLWDAATGELLYLVAAGDDAMLVRVAVTGSICEVRSVQAVDDTAALARYTLLQGSLA